MQIYMKYWFYQKRNVTPAPYIRSGIQLLPSGSNSHARPDMGGRSIPFLGPLIQKSKVVMHKEGRGREGKEDSIVGGNHPGTLISTDIKILEIGFASKREVKA